MSENGPVTSLRALLGEGANRERIASYMEALSPSERVAQTQSLHGKEVAKLYAACAGGGTPTFEDIVPVALGDDRTVIFEGRNSLPMFTGFQKRFARMGKDIVGYNHQTMSFITGPGVFLVREAHASSDVPEELYFDYTGIPERIPSGFPAFKRNDSGLSNLVYANMKDYMRTVCTGVMVGAAYKQGKAENAFFVLARGE
ncbi:MAG: hypothetical protein FJ096_08795 [Deltaproteobacteria bacterium]|nr:hypothetical protein [Deltaproteobacteria bacterium]